jgi:hypothetical protein
MLRHAALAMLLSMGAASGCASAGPASMPAAPTPACIEQMAAFASRQSGRPVTLTEQAFRGSDMLLLEQRVIRGADGRPLDGRMMGRPEAFRLLRDELGRCVMRHERTGATEVLTACACQQAQAGTR